MKTFLKAIVLVPIAILAIAFAVANRRTARQAKAEAEEARAEADRLRAELDIQSRKDREAARLAGVSSGPLPALALHDAL